MKLLTDTTTVFTREMGPVLRNPAGLVLLMAQPLVFLPMFGPLLSGIEVPVADGDSAWQWFVPAILVMTGGFATGGAGYELTTELGGGSLERLFVTPLNRAAILLGKTFKESAALLGLVLLVVLGIGLGAFTIGLVIVSRHSPGLFWGVQQVLLFPLVLLSGVLLPVESAPGWLIVASQINPITFIVEAERLLFAGEIIRFVVLYGGIAAAFIAAAGLFVGIRAMRRAAL